MISPFSTPYQKRQFWRSSSLKYEFVAVLLLLALYYGFHRHEAGLLATQAFCDRTEVTTKAGEPPEPSNEVTNATYEAATPMKEFSVEKLVTNSTLGFEKIIALGLPERSDRRDMLTLMTSLQNVQLTWMDATKGSDMSPKAYPNSWNSHKGYEKDVTPPELGNWRSHCNALRSVIEHGYASALIVEDDIDWDVSFKSQLNQFAQVARVIQEDSLPPASQLNATSTSISPYGDHWDVLLLGTCANPQAGPDAKSFQGADNQLHYVYEVHGGTACTYGYAVTQASARMLLGHLLDIASPTDFAISNFCKSHMCLQVWPQLISSYRPAGSQQKDSDIRNEGQTTEDIREHGETWNIVNSAITQMLREFSKDSPSPA